MGLLARSSTKSSSHVLHQAEPHPVVPMTKKARVEAHPVVTPILRSNLLGQVVAEAWADQEAVQRTDWVAYREDG
jgi:hypothetical protein